MSGNGTLKNFKAMMAEARLPERTVQICLRGDLVADHEAAERELERAEKAAITSLAGNGTAEIADRIQALEEQMREHTYAFRLRAMPKPKFRAIVAAHPSRRDDEGRVIDADRLGVNSETFFDALILTCLVDPELTAEEFGELADVLTENQYDHLSTAAWNLNKDEVDIPFSLAASRTRRNSASE